MMVFLKSVGVKRNRATLLCKKGAAAMRKSARLKIRIRRGHGNALRPWSGETAVEKEGERSQKNPPVNPACWGMRQTNPPRGSLKSLRKTLAARGDATQDFLRDYHRSFERRYTRRQPRR
jgi:hypothetical protein